MANSYVDLHCHPAMKPFGKSFNGTAGENTTNRRKKNSIWFYDSPNFFEKAIQLLSGICKFTQADCTTLAHGNVRVVCASLYPIERGFFRNDLGSGLIADLAASFATGVGDKRVDHIQAIKNYFKDVELEYNYYVQGQSKSVSTDSGKFNYIIARNFEELEQTLSNDQNTIVLIMTIEGLHVLHEDYDNPSDNVVLQNVRKIKAWNHVPFFVTVAHHFNNHLCGHARSLFGLVGSKTNQEKNLDEPFFEIGTRVVEELLSTQNGKRIYVDVKHMSARSRADYIDLVTNPSKGYVGEDIPIIISHGAANGRRSMYEPVIDIMETGPYLLRDDINFYDDEIIAMAKSNGIIGLQLDERRIADKEALKRVKNSLWISKIRHYRAELLWRQIQHIAELLDKHFIFAWDCMAIGSDYDGIIDPLNGYLTQETVVHLEEYVERHAYDYMNGRGKLILKPFNQLEPDEIVQRIFHSNAIAFMRIYFK